MLVNIFLSRPLESSSPLDKIGPCASLGFPAISVLSGLLSLADIVTMFLGGLVSSGNLSSGYSTTSDGISPSCEDRELPAP